MRLVLLVAAICLASPAGFAAEKENSSSKSRRRGGSPRSHGTMMKLTALHTALEEFKAKCGAYPTTAQGGLRALFIVPAGVNCAGYEPLDAKDTQWLQDGFGNEFSYECKDGKTFTLRSPGADRKRGGRGESENIVVDPREKKHIE